MMASLGTARCAWRSPRTWRAWRSLTKPTISAPLRSFMIRPLYTSVTALGNKILGSRARGSGPTRGCLRRGSGRAGESLGDEAVDDASDLSVLNPDDLVQRQPNGLASGQRRVLQARQVLDVVAPADEVDLVAAVRPRHLVEAQVVGGDLGDRHLSALEAGAPAGQHLGDLVMTLDGQVGVRLLVGGVEGEGADQLA